MVAARKLKVEVRRAEPQLVRAWTAVTLPVAAPVDAGGALVPRRRPSTRGFRLADHRREARKVDLRHARHRLLSDTLEVGSVLWKALTFRRSSALSCCLNAPPSEFGFPSLIPFWMIRVHDKSPAVAIVASRTAAVLHLRLLDSLLRRVLSRSVLQLFDDRVRTAGIAYSQYAGSRTGVLLALLEAGRVAAGLQHAAFGRPWRECAAVARACGRSVYATPTS